MRRCKDSKVSITNLRVVNEGQGEDTTYTAVLQLRPRFAVNRELLLSHIRGISGVIDIEET